MIFINTYNFEILLFFVGLLGGFIGAIGGSGGLLLMPFMIAGGLPPAVALGSARFAAIGAWTIAFKKFHDAGKIRWREAPLIIVIAVIAGSIGTWLMIDIPEAMIYPIVGITLVLVAPLALLKKDFGLHETSSTTRSRAKGYVLYFLAMVYGGFFGAGASVMIMIVLVRYLGFTAFQAFALELTAWIVMSVVSSAIFIINGKVDYLVALILFISMGIGSYFGAKVALKGGSKLIKYMVSLFAIAVGIKLLLTA